MWIWGGMTFFNINPLTGASLQGGQVQEQQQAAEKARQVRRAQSLARDVGAEGDRFEHQVESPEQVAATRDQQNPQDGSGKRKHKQHSAAGDGKPGLDVKA